MAKVQTRRNVLNLVREFVVCRILKYKKNNNISKYNKIKYDSDS